MNAHAKAVEIATKKKSLQEHLEVLHLSKKELENEALEPTDELVTTSSIDM